LTQGEIESAVTNLTGIEKTTAASNASITNADLDKENATLDKYRLLEQSSEFAFVQANITQSIVLKLLSTSLSIDPIEYSESKDKVTYGTNDKDNVFTTTNDYVYEPTTSSNNNFASNTSSNNAGTNSSNNSSVNSDI
jgi:hypothetical protein